jgi:hypothetical protein
MLKAVTNLINVSQITGVLPVVNGGTGVTTSTGTGNVVLSAAPTLSGDVSLSTGNLVMSTSGKGIDFSATSGAGTSELFNDYEEGTWTPNIYSSIGAITSYTASGIYTKVGRIVTVALNILITNNGTGAGSVNLDNLPFTSTSNRFFGSGQETDITGSILNIQSIASTSVAVIAGVGGVYPGGANYRLQLSLTYTA